MDEAGRGLRTFSRNFTPPRPTSPHFLPLFPISVNLRPKRSASFFAEMRPPIPPPTIPTFAQGTKRHSVRFFYPFFRSPSDANRHSPLATPSTQPTRRAADAIPRAPRPSSPQSPRAPQKAAHATAGHVSGRKPFPDVTRRKR